ncbi:MAG: hypothetical protein KC613_18340 [Myxococcales bacterium]|nr:hypothetical protein [Myxococcales bacterium]
MSGVPTLVIPEVEVSVTAACSLACAQCGFFVPDQPRPFDGPAQDGLIQALTVLEQAGVRITSLALLGGEATLAPAALLACAQVARASPAVERVEVVTNGLTPKGLPAALLPLIDRLSLSDYTADDELASAWARFLERVAPEVEFRRRRHGQWDPVDTLVDLGVEGGQRAYDACWYRRHCVTLERGRLFVCSRLPKRRHDEAGLPLRAGLTADRISAHLQAPAAPTACRFCSQMAGLPGVVPGRQPDDRLPKLRARALTWLAQTR